MPESRRSWEEKKKSLCPKKRKLVEVDPSASSQCQQQQDDAKMEVVEHFESTDIRFKTKTDQPRMKETGLSIFIFSPAGGGAEPPQLAVMKYVKPVVAGPGTALPVTRPCLPTSQTARSRRK